MKVWRVPYPKYGAGIGLHRVSAIARALGLDLAAFGANGAVITGSNGKGSTAAMLAAILQRSGQRVGLFTSPHLFRLNERFRIDGDDIEDDELAPHWKRAATAVDFWRKEHDEEVGGFEFLFLVAADWFAARKCRFTVWEAGIGGRYDPTRSVRPRRTALTALDFEHTALLGETLEEIAYDKLDAAPGGAKAFVAASCLPLRERIEGYCDVRDVTPIFVEPESAFAAPLAGAFQRSNAALAIALARDMARVTDAHIGDGLKATRWLGRLEIIESDPLVVIDAGHTPAAIRAALAGFHEMRGARDGVLVCGASGDKNVSDLIAALAPAFPRIVCVQALHKGAPVAEIATAAAAANPEAEISIAESIADARALALHKAGPVGAIYVAGGLFLAAEFKAAHQGLDPATLAFF